VEAYALNPNLIISPPGEPQPTELPAIPLHIQLTPASMYLDAREIELVSSVLDDIVQEMQRLEAEAGDVPLIQPLPFAHC